ncbi:MAG: hypothetical protein KF812_06620 [Fimbriimonadaceae bacterium]|nr:hypothetical protein [Fimbriimonadaceae bacterium]
MINLLAFNRFMDNVLPIISVVLVFGIPIIAILTAHQRKMAELIHQRNSGVDQNLANELLAMRREMSEMRDRLNALTVASDRVQLPPLSATASPEISREEAEQRLQ